MIGFGKNNKGTKTSSFWLDPVYFRGSKYSTTEERESGDLLKLASVRRSVANFVNIVTGKNIPVKFASSGMSGTDGKTVVISADLTKFDTVCGLALHEGSHIKLSNFKILENMQNNPRSFFDKKWLNDMSIKYGKTIDETAVLLIGRLKNLTNYVEDRRIDNFIYTNAPGYQGYYESMYEEYWNSPKISEGLKSAFGRDEVWESYAFRVINLTNINTDLRALKGLQEIWNLLDLSNIDRLKKTEDALHVAQKMLEIIEKYTSATSDEKEDGDGEKGDGEPGDGEKGEGEPGDGEKGEGEEGEKSEGDVSSDNQEVDKTSDKGTPQTPPPILTDKDVEALIDALEKQKKFLDGEVDHKQLSDDKKEMVESMEEAGTEQKEVGKGLGGISNGANSVSSIIVKNFNKRILDANPFGIFLNSPSYQNEVEEGMKLGKLLGKKIQIRNEEQTLKTTRLRTGKIDDRLIHSLGYGAEQVFERTFVDVFNPLHLHISIDASGSMCGRKWTQTMIATVAIAKAASMVSNLNVVISFRYTGVAGGRSWSSDHKPLVLVAYDSKKDDIMKVKQLFPYLTCPSSTPEGLCIEGILDLIADGNNNQDSYFINFSDGEPYFSNKNVVYSGDAARLHTKRMMDQMRSRGIKILSYFIGGGYDSMDHFKQMYGKDAENVDVTSLIPLAKTLNKLFIKK